MKRLTIVLLVVISLGGLGTAVLTFRQQQRVNDRLARVEQAVSTQRPPAVAHAPAPPDPNRLFWLMLRAQESPWQSTPGSPIEARLVASYDEAPVSVPVELVAQIRNASDKNQTVSGLLFHPLTIKLYHDGNACRYLGPAASMAPGKLPALPPGRVVTESLTITPQDFAEIGQPGEFVAEWRYVSGYGDSRLTWKGELPAVRVEWSAPPPRTR